MRKILLIAALTPALALSALLPGADVYSTPAAEAQEQQNTFTRAEIEGIVRDYLLTNPEIMYEVQAALEEKQRKEQDEASRNAIAQAEDEIFNNPQDGVVGNPEGSVTVVEFFDYNCGFCERALADMEALIEEHDDLRFVLKEFPILGADSQKAHVVSMALREVAPEKYDEFHRRLLGGGARANEDTAVALALELGVDEEALRSEMQNPAIMETFANTYALADQLQITGTPSYVIGEEVVSGAQGAEFLSEKIESVRP